MELPRLDHHLQVGTTLGERGRFGDSVICRSRRLYLISDLETSSRGLWFPGLSFWRVLGGLEASFTQAELSRVLGIQGGTPFSGGVQIHRVWDGLWRFGHLGCPYSCPIYQLAYFLGWMDTFGRRAELLRVSAFYWSVVFFSWRVWHSDLPLLIFISYSSFGGIFCISERIL